MAFKSIVVKTEKECHILDDDDDDDDYYYYYYYYSK